MSTRYGIPRDAPAEKGKHNPKKQKAERPKKQSKGNFWFGFTIGIAFMVGLGGFGVILYRLGMLAQFLH